MTPKYIGITGGPGEHELHRAHDNYKNRQSVTIWLLPDHDHDMYVRGLTHLREWSTEDDGQYLFSGRLIARHREAGFAYFPKIEGEYDSHRRRGHLEVLNDFRLIYVIDDDKENFFLSDGWDFHTDQPKLYAAVAHDHIYWEEDVADTVCYYVEKRTDDDSWQRILEVKVIDERAGQYELLPLAT